MARRTQQKELKPIFGCLNDPSLEEKVKSELSTFLHQFRVKPSSRSLLVMLVDLFLQKIFVPKELCLRVEDDEQQQQANGDESAVKEEKTKRVSKKKSLISKKGLANESTPTSPMVTMNSPTTAKRTGSASNIVEGASPSKRRKMNLNENCSIVMDECDVQMSECLAPSQRPVVQVVRLSSADVESFSSSKSNNVLDEVKATTPLTVISNEPTSGCTLLVPKRKSTAI